jgi:two-component system sensor histidine kinase and response regulator WspE
VAVAPPGAPDSGRGRLHHGAGGRAVSAENRGYEVDVAVDGMDGWNALRSGNYDLTVSDVDMPRMTGIELVVRIKADARLQNMPVIMVSYKDREEDRLRGLEAGADRYMTKSSFHDETLVAAVLELIGPPE